MRKVILAKSHISELLLTKYRKRHQLMLYLYDILVDILVKADKYQLSSLSFRFTNEINDEIDLFDELDRQKDLDISEYVYIPHIFFSILRDLNYYLFESLSCIEREKLLLHFLLLGNLFKIIYFI